MQDDLAQLRRQQADARRALEALSAPEGRHAAALVGVVYDGGAIPTVVPRVFLTHSAGIACQEVANASPTITPGGESVPVLVLGPRVPVVGDRLLARQIGGLWVAQMGGYPAAPTVAIPGCGCATIPQVFTLSTSATCQFTDATIRWVPVAGTGLETVITTPNAFLSDATFSSGGDTWRYHVTCVAGSLFIGYAYTFSSFFGGPFLDSPRYVWGVASPGNTCIPWLMTAGGAINAGNCPANSLVLSP